MITAHPDVVARRLPRRIGQTLALEFPAMNFLLLIFENIRRNKLRTGLTAMGTMILVFVVTLVWTILTFIDKQVTEKSENVKAIITEKWRIPSQMPYSYRASLIEGAAESDEQLRPEDYMTWTFYGGSTEKDRSKVNFSNILFAFVMEPDKVMTMLDDLDESSLPPEQAEQLTRDVEKLCETRTGILLGRTSSITSTRRSATASRSTASITRTSTWSLRSSGHCPPVATTVPP